MVLQPQRRWQRRASIVALVACLAFPPLAHADRVQLANGDVLTGDVLELHAGYLVLETKYAGNVSIAVTHIERIETDRPFSVHSRDGRMRTGTLRATPDGLEIDTIEGEVDTVDLAEVTAITPPHYVPSQLRWFANANFGADIRMRTDNEREVNLDGAFVGEWGRNSVQLEADLEREHEEGELTDAEYEFFLRAKRNISGPWSFVLFNRYEHDRSEDLDLRISAGPAIGYRLFDSARDALRLEAGPAYLFLNYEHYPSEHVPITRVALTYTALRLAQRLRLEHEDSIINAIEHPKNFLFRSDTGVTWRVAGSFTIGAKFQAQFATETAPDIDEQDLQLILTIGYQGGDRSLKP